MIIELEHRIINSYNLIKYYKITFDNWSIRFQVSFYVSWHGQTISFCHLTNTWNNLTLVGTSALWLFCHLVKTFSIAISSTLEWPASHHNSTWKTFNVTISSASKLPPLHLYYLKRTFIIAISHRVGTSSLSVDSSTSNLLLH